MLTFIDQKIDWIQRNGTGSGEEKCFPYLKPLDTPTGKQATSME